MPAGSKKRKAAKKPKPDGSQSAIGEPIELETGLEEGVDNDGEMGEGSRSRETPVRAAEAMAEGGVAEEVIDEENVGVQPVVGDMKTTVVSPDQQEHDEADPVQAEPEEEIPVGVEAVADAAPIEIEPELEAPADIKPKVDAASVEIEQEVDAPIEIEPQVEALVEIEPEAEVEALVEAQPDEQGPAEAEPGQQDLVEIEPDQPVLVEIEPDQHVADEVEASESGGDLQVGDAGEGLNVERQQDGGAESGELDTSIPKVDPAAEQTVDVVAELPVVEVALGEQADCDTGETGEDLNAVKQQDEGGGAELSELDTSISEVDQVAEPQEQVVDVAVEPPVVEELGEQADPETLIQDLPNEPPTVSVSNEAISIEESSLSIPVLEASIDVDDEGPSHEQENQETIEEDENLSSAAVTVAGGGTVEGVSDEQELDADEPERENAGDDGQGTVEGVSNELEVDANEQERAADGGYGEDEAVSASAEDTSEVVLPSGQELGTEMPSADEQQVELDEQELGSGPPPGKDQQVCTELDEQELGTGPPPGKDQQVCTELDEQELGTEQPHVEEQELSMEVSAADEQELGIELPPADEQELVEQGLDTNPSSSEPEMAAETHEPEDDAVSLAADQGDTIEQQLVIEPPLSEQDRDIGEDEATTSMVADSGYGEDEAFSASAEDTSEAVPPSGQELGIEMPSADEQQAGTELDEQELVIGPPPANDQDLVAEQPPIDEEEQRMELCTADEQELGIELPPAVEQELVEQGLDTNPPSSEPEMAAEVCEPEDEALSLLAADQGATIEQELDFEPPLSEQERDIREDEATTSTVAEVGSVLNDLDEALAENVPDEQELDSELLSAEQEVGVPDSKEFDDTFSSEASDLVGLGQEEEQLDSEPPPIEQDRSLVQSSEVEADLSLASEGEAGLSPAAETEDEVDASIEQELDDPSEKMEAAPENAEQEAESADQAPAPPVEEVPGDELPDVKLSSLLQEETVQEKGEDEVHLSAGAAEDMPDEQELNLTEEDKSAYEDAEVAADSALTVETSNERDSIEQVDSALEIPSPANPDDLSAMAEDNPIERMQGEQDLASVNHSTDDPIEAIQNGENLVSVPPPAENPVEIVQDEQGLDSAPPPSQLESSADCNLCDVVQSSVASEDPIEILPFEQELDNGDAVAGGPKESPSYTNNGDGAEGSFEGVVAEPELDSRSRDGIEKVFESATELETSDSVLIDNGLMSNAITDGQQALPISEAPTHGITESQDEADIHVGEANEVSEAKTHAVEVKEVSEADIHAGKWEKVVALPEEVVKVLSVGGEKGVAPQVDGLKLTEDPLPTSTAESLAQENRVLAHSEEGLEENSMGIDSSNGTVEASIEPAAAAAAVSKEKKTEGVQPSRNESTQEASLSVVVPVQKDVNQRALEYVNQKGADRTDGGATLARRTNWLGCCGMFDLLLRKD